ncbi:MAG: ABC transporter permease [Bacillota bacterium]
MTVTALAILVAVPLAWLVVKTDLPGRRFWRWALALPLAIPPYIGAFVYMVLFAPYIYGFGGTALVLMIFTYPYIFLMVAASLASMNSSLEEAAMISGCGPWQVFRRVILPLLRPAIGAGSLLVALYVLADFGTVAMLRFQTFSSAVYTQLVGRYDRSAAAVLSAILVVITIALIWLEWRSRAGVRYDQTTGAYRPGQIYKLGHWRYPALAVVRFLSVMTRRMPWLFPIRLWYCRTGHWRSRGRRGKSTSTRPAPLWPVLWANQISFRGLSAMMKT